MGGGEPCLLGWPSRLRLCSTTATHATQVGAEVEREVLHHHRLCPHAHVIGLDGDSYRTRAHRDTINQQTK